MTRKTATALPVRTTADLWPVTVIGMGESPRVREGKTTPDGELTYGSGCILRVQRKDGEIKADKSASVHVTKPASVYELGVEYVARGQVFVQPYESNGRMALSITVEELLPASGVAGTNRPAGKAENAA